MMPAGVQMGTLIVVTKGGLARSTIPPRRVTTGS